jgi:hypothetical protein
MVYFGGGCEKKALTKIAEHWHASDKVEIDIDDLTEQAAQLGIAEFAPDAITRRECSVWPEHQDALLVFTASSTQWRAAGRAIVGLDYNAVFQIMDLYGITDRAKVLEDVQIIETRAIELFSETLRKAQ